MSISIDSPVSMISGVGKTRNEQLSRLGIHTVRDLLYYFPRAYENRGEVRLLGDYDTEFSRSYLLTVASNITSAKVKSGLTISKFRAFDDSGSVEVVFFNSPYIKDIFHVGRTFRFYGRTSFNKTKRLTLTNPKYEPISEGVILEDFLPIYKLTDGLSSKAIEKLVRHCINDFLPMLKDPLPEHIRIKVGLPTLSQAIKNAHFPPDEDKLLSARRRLAFDEMFYFGLAISVSASKKELTQGVRFERCDISPLLDLLPYELTDAQKNVVNDIYRDTVLKKVDGKTPAMSRILVGDVGSGKTICATIAIYIAYLSGYQSALMVPTEILANQHYEDIGELLGKLGVKVELLTGSTTQARKRSIYTSLENGEIDVIIGTHALLSDKVRFSKLGLIVTDEQHRFGVKQRAVIKEKVTNAHTLVMSATPIPRSLALALYGDLDISRIEEMPKGRQRVDTFVVDEGYRTRIDNFIKKQVEEGGQVYIVCPSIEKDEEFDGEELVPTGLTIQNLRKDSHLKSAVEYTEELKKRLKGVSIECLHGRMKNQEKDEIMSRFVSAETRVLVSTTVIEVGVNVPSATLMIVENADRFGLSQLHQLRGRVGRGNKKSYCILVSDISADKARSRLEVMRTTYDGYQIAEKDLILRGPGDFFSSVTDDNLRQSGGLDFHFASACDDSELFESAFSYAKEIANIDPELISDEYYILKNEIALRITKASLIS